jgi:hypothetical protein
MCVPLATGLLLALAAPLPGASETLEVIGANGTSEHRDGEDGVAILLGASDPSNRVTARGGNAASGGEGGGGIATLEAFHAGPDPLTLYCDARGGTGGSSLGGADGKAGGDATVSAVGTTLDADIDIYVVSDGGTGGRGYRNANGGDGGAVHFGPVAGFSESGDVAVSASGRGGGPGIGSGASGAGASVVMENVVTGNTAGSLGLRQLAWAGRGGNAISTLNHEGASRKRVVSSLGIAGDGGTDVGGTGLATGTVLNRDGEALVSARAQGGLSANGDGGPASAVLYAESWGDGHRVQTNTSYWEGVYATAVGGASAPGPGHRGGDAWSTSVGVARGNSPVYVSDVVYGGHARYEFRNSDARAGDGGMAVSQARGETGGYQPVFVQSFARGGNGGLWGYADSTPLPDLDYDAAGRAGDAMASSDARGDGQVTSRAWASAGGGVPAHRPPPWILGAPLSPEAWTPHAARNGSASARAKAEGGSGTAEAISETVRNIAGNARAIASAELGGFHVDLASHTAYARGFEDAPERVDGYAFGSLYPNLRRGALMKRGSRQFAGAEPPELIAIGSLDGATLHAGLEGAATFRQSVSFDFRATVESGSERLFLEILDVGVGPAGFDSASVSISRDGRVIESVALRNDRGELAEFASSVFDIGEVLPPVFVEESETHPGGAIIPAHFEYSRFEFEVVLEVTASDARSGFGFDLLIAQGGSRRRSSRPRH